MKSKKLIMSIILGTLTILLIACGTNDSGEASDDSEELEGDVIVDGSGTVYPLMELLAEEYMINAQPRVSVEVSRSGTGAGFTRFLNEETDFNDASRAIKAEEQAESDEKGMEIMELKLALDGLTIVIHPDNDWATELTPEQVNAIFLGEYTNWSDLDPTWPDDKINTYGPNETHGTYEFFVENMLEEQDFVSDVDLQQEYPTLVTLISEDKNAIGFFGFGYYVNNQDTIRAVHIDFGEGPIEPTLETIGEDTEYAPYTRPVFTYLNVDKAKEKPQVLDFAIFAVDKQREFADDKGFAPIPDEETEAIIADLETLK